MFRAKPVVIVPRDEWGALPPKATVPMNYPIKKVVITFDTDIDVCTNKEDCIKSTQILQLRHMNFENSDDIKYNFLVGGDGNVYEGRGWKSQPCRSLQYPEHHNERLDIAFMGRYPDNDAVPTKLTIAAYDTAKIGVDNGLVEEWYNLYEIKPPEKIEVDPESE